MKEKIIEIIKEARAYHSRVWDPETGYKSEGTRIVAGIAMKVADELETIISQPEDAVDKKIICRECGYEQLTCLHCGARSFNG